MHSLFKLFYLFPHCFSRHQGWTKRKQFCVVVECWLIHCQRVFLEYFQVYHTGYRSVFRGVGLFCGTVAFHLHLPPVVDVPPGGGLPLHLLQPPHGAAAAVAARTHWDLGNSGQHGVRKERKEDKQRMRAERKKKAKRTGCRGHREEREEMKEIRTRKKLLEMLTCCDTIAL